jgi:endonuclease YncB( thermonuclease family)
MAGLLLAACGDGAKLDRLAAGETGRVASVKSGDEVVLANGLDVRVTGIQAPWPDEPGGAQARDALAALVLGRDVQLFYGGARRDSHGRALAQVRIVDGRRWVEGAMLSEGWARVRTFGDNRALAQPMLDAEADARAARRGLWAMKDYEVRLPQEVTADVTGFQLVEGRVEGVTGTDRGTYLDFRKDRRGFAVLIDAHAVGDFEAAGAAPSSLMGRLVRVRGIVGRDGQMRIDHPEPVELLKER